MTCNVYIIKDDDWYVATDIASSVASQGKTMEESLANLKEALALYYEDSPVDESVTPVFFTTIETYL